MANIHITIDDQQLEVAEGITILEAARGNGIHIPTLCFLKELDPRASCRICVVEVEGMRTFQPSCSTKVRDGMVVRTNTEAVRANRKLTLELIMAHHPVDCHHCLRIGSSKEQDLDPKFCEMCFFCDCVRDGICELQALNREYHVDNLPFALEGCRYEEDVSLHSIIRNSNKCVKCRRCVDVCNDVQNVHNLAMFSRGQDYRVTASMGKPMQESLCVRCGRCVDVCPTGALYMEESIDHMLSDAHTYGITTVGMVSASVLPELERLNHMEPGTLDIHRVIAGMKKIRLIDEDVSRRTIAVYIKATKLTGRVLAQACLAVGRKIKKAHRARQTPHGKQTVRQLMGHGAATNSIEVESPKDFDRVARRWNVDYAFYKTGPDKYLLFFKSGQADAITACFSEYSRRVMKRSKSRRVPIREQLKRAAAELARQPSHKKERAREAVHEDR